MSIINREGVMTTIQEQRETYRSRIRADFEEAINAGISKFEFDGDYKYEYLGGYAREEWDRLFRQKYYLKAARNVEKMLKEKTGKKYVFLNDYCRYARKLAKINTRQLEDRRHVYVQLDLDSLERFESILTEDALNKYQKEIKEFEEGKANAGKENERQV